MKWVKSVDYSGGRAPASTLAIILIFASSVFLFFAFRTGHQLYTYYSHSASASAVVLEWRAERLSSDRYVLDVSYEFEASDRPPACAAPSPEHLLYESEGRLKFFFLNELAALDAANRFDSLTAWYIPHHPESSLLEKHFPIKNCFYTAIILGVLLYFGWLSTRIARLG